MGQDDLGGGHTPSFHEKIKRSKRKEGRKLSPLDDLGRCFKGRWIDKDGNKYAKLPIRNEDFILSITFERWTDIHGQIRQIRSVFDGV